MLNRLCKSKLHRLTVTETNLTYRGSITLDADLIDAAKIVPYEMVVVVNINTGARFETYVIEGARKSGVVCLNGAAARLAEPDDLVIVMAWSLFTEEECRVFKQVVVQVDEKNRIQP